MLVIVFSYFFSGLLSDSVSGGSVQAPHPEKVDPAVVTDYLEWWNVEAEVHQGGANPEGIALNGKPKTEITIAIVALTVYVEI